MTSDNDGKYDNYCSYCPAQAAPRPLPTANNHSFIFMRTLTHCLTVCTYSMPSCDSHSEHGLLDICLLSARWLNGGVKCSTRWQNHFWKVTFGVSVQSAEWCPALPSADLGRVDDVCWWCDDTLPNYPARGTPLVHWRHWFMNSATKSWCEMVTTTHCNDLEDGGHCRGRVRGGWQWSVCWGAATVPCPVTISSSGHLVSAQLCLDSD